MLTKKDRKKRYNKKPQESIGHSFAGWGQMTRDAFKGDNLGGAVSGLASAAAGAVNTGMEAAQLHGVDEAQAEIDAQKAFQSTAVTQDDLLAEMAGSVDIKSNYTKKDFMQSGGDFAKGMISGALSGAGSGAAAGPWGAVAGGAASLLSGVIGRITASVQAGKEVKEKNQGAKEANLAKAQTLTAKAGALDQAADARAQAAYFAEGGSINTPQFPEFPSEVTEFNTGGSHEENPYDGIPQGIAPDGLPNLVEEGEVKYDNYIFSDRLMLNKNDKKKYKFLKGKTYADAAKAIKKELGIDERPNDLIAKTDLEEHLNILSMLQEEERAKRGLRGENRMMYKNGGHIFSGWNSVLQSAPAIGNAIGVLTQAFNTPDYKHAKELQQSNEKFTPISYTPLTQRMVYKPLDVNYYANKLASQAGTTRRAIREQTGSNPYAATAALLSADANVQSQMGDLYRKAEEYNLAQREKVNTFNRATDSANAEMAMKTAQLNNSLKDRMYSRQLERDAMAARLKMAEDQAWSQSMSTSMTSMFNNLGDIAKQKMSKEMAKDYIRGMINAQGFDYDKFGNIYKIDYNDDDEGDDHSMKLGGKIHISKKSKKKRGFTV